MPAAPLCSARRRSFSSRVYRDHARDGTKRVCHEDFGAAVFHHADYLQELIRRLGVGEAIATQDTFALVLKCADGTGKTFATLTVRRMLAGKLNLVTLYLGLSAGWDLQDAEEKFTRN